MKSGRDGLLAAKVKVEPVDLTAFDMDGIYVRGMNAAETDAYQLSLMRNPGKSDDVNLANQRAKLCVYTICDESGKRLFGEPGDVDRLAQLPGDVMTVIFMAARKVSGMLSKAEIEAEEKNSDGGQPA